MLKVINANGTSQLVPTPTDRVYYYGKSALAPVATPTAVAVIKASASKVTRIRRIAVTGAATAAGSMPLIVTKRTDDGTPGSAALTAVTPARANTDDGAATASVSTVGTANYTTMGTSQGVVYAGRITMTALGTGVDVSPKDIPIEMPLLLKKGSTEQVTIELGGAALPSGGVVDINVVLEESDE